MRPGFPSIGKALRTQRETTGEKALRDTVAR